MNNILNSEYVKSFQEDQKRFAEFMRSAFESLKRYEPQMKYNLKKLYAINHEVIKKLKKDKVFLIPFFGHHYLQDLYELFLKDRKKGAMQAYHDFFAQESNIKRLIARWSRIPNFCDRIPIFEKALQAHLRKDYELSIPVLIIQIEGLLNIVCESANYDKNKFTTKLKGDKIVWFEEYNDIFDDAIEKEVFKSSVKKNSPKLTYPYRNLILHGHDIEYYKDPLNSTKIILLLDYLTMAFNRLRKDKKHKA